MPSPGDGYKAADEAPAITDELRSVFLPARLGEASGWLTALKRNEERLRGFESPDTFDAVAILRITDGKRLLERIKARHQIRYDLRGYLARAIHELGLIPEELRSWLDTLCKPPISQTSGTHP